MTVKEICVSNNINVKKRLAAYCRVSTDSEDQINSFLAQIRYYRDYVKNHNEYEFVDIYADEGISGTSLNNRNEFNRLLSDCKRKKIDCIITKSVSRFARNTNDLLTVIRMLKELGVKVIFEEQGIDTDKINSEMIVAFPGLAAQQESQNISDNVRWSNKKRMENGNFKTTAIPFGYKKENDEFIINAKEAEVVRVIFNLYLSGCGKSNIANILNEKYSSTQLGDVHWTRCKINYILNNEKYMGDAIFQKKYTTETLPRKQKINRGEMPKYYVENHNPAIISKDVFKKAKTMQENKISNRVSTANHIFSGMLRCKACGSLFRKTYSNKVSYWICSNKASSTTNCKTHMLRESDILLTFKAVMFKLKDNRKGIVDSLISNIKTLHSRINTNHSEILNINTKIAEYLAKSHMIAKLHTRGVLEDSEYISQTTEINQSITKLRNEYKNFVAEDKYVKLLDELEKLSSTLESYNLETELTKDFLNELIKSVVIDENDIMTITLIGNLEIQEKVII